MYKKQADTIRFLCADGGNVDGLFNIFPQLTLVLPPPLLLPPFVMIIWLFVSSSRYNKTPVSPTRGEPITGR